MSFDYEPEIRPADNDNEPFNIARAIPGLFFNHIRGITIGTVITALFVALAPYIALTQ